MSVAVVVDSNGFYIAGSDIPDYGGEQPSLPEGQRLVIEPPVPGGLYKPKFDGTNWVEGATPEEIKAAQTPKPRKWENVA